MYWYNSYLLRSIAVVSGDFLLPGAAVLPVFCDMLKISKFSLVVARVAEAGRI